jgi:hypothetical protein
MGNKVNTILFFQNVHEDTSWASVVLHSAEGFNSIQEMVEAIAKAFKKAIDNQVEECWGNCWHCSIDRRSGLSICKKCGKSTKAPKVTREDVERIMEQIFNGTMQDFAGDGGAWETLQEEGIQSFGLKGDGGQVVSIYNGPEIITRTIFDGFSVEYQNDIGRCSSVKLHKEDEE